MRKTRTCPERVGVSVLSWTKVFQVVVLELFSSDLYCPTGGKLGEAMKHKWNNLFNNLKCLILVPQL